MYQILLMVLLLPFGVQEPDPDAQYRQDYEEFEVIRILEDPAERATKFMDFVEQGFDDRLLANVLAGIRDSVGALAAAGELETMYPLADRWDAQTGGMDGAVLSLQNAAAAGSHPMIVKYGEIIYAANPIVDIADILAVSHSALGDNDKYLEYANLVIEEKGVAESFGLAYPIFQQEVAGENWDTAAGWANRLKALTAAPGGVSVAEWRNIGIEFQWTIARAEFEGGRWENAIREYQTLQGMGREQRAIANFFMARSHLEIGGPDQVNLALARFADTAVLDDPTYSDPALSMVEEIYALNSADETLEGLEEEFLAPARARMQ